MRRWLTLPWRLYVKRHSILSAILVVAGVALAACGDDAGGSADAGRDSGPTAGSGETPDKDAGGKPDKDAGSKPGKDASAEDSGSEDDAGSSAAQTFHVPSGGGSFHFT